MSNYYESELYGLSDRAKATWAEMQKDILATCNEMKLTKEQTEKMMRREFVSLKYADLDNCIKKYGAMLNPDQYVEVRRDMERARNEYTLIGAQNKKLCQEFGANLQRRMQNKQKTNKAAPQRKPKPAA